MNPNAPISRNSRTRPSNRVKSPWINPANTMTDATDIGTSRRNIAGFTGTAANSVAQPSTNEMLATLEPITLPTPMSRFPSAAAIPDTTISGALVPKPTITDPTITGAIRITTAKRTAPFTN